jgi:hypothetical protein
MWEVNMILHAGSGFLIFGATMFWGFWAISDKTFNPISTSAGQIAEKTLGAKPALHSYSGIMAALFALPLVVSGFVPYVRRWQAKDGATYLVKMRDVHKVSNFSNKSSKLVDVLDWFIYGSLRHSIRY